MKRCPKRSMLPQGRHQGISLQDYGRQVAIDEHQFAVAFENAPTGMALIAPDARVLRANKALCAMLGMTEPQLQALTTQDVVHPDDAPADLADRINLLAGEKESLQAE